MNEKINNIKVLVEEQVNQIKDPLVKSALQKILVEPSSHLREWDYSNTEEQFECWTIAIDEPSDTSIVYSEFGHGPKNPWGLVFTSTDFFGTDAAWYDKLEDCFLETRNASNLPIWFIERRWNVNQVQLIAENLTLDKAFELVNIKTKENKEYYVNSREYTPESSD